MIKALRKTTDLSVYSHPSVQLIVKYQWSYWKNLNIILIILPYVLLLFAFTAYSCFILPHYDETK